MYGQADVLEYLRNYTANRRGLEKESKINHFAEDSLLSELRIRYK